MMVVANLPSHHPTMLFHASFLLEVISVTTVVSRLASVATVSFAKSMGDIDLASGTLVPSSKFFLTDVASLSANVADSAACWSLVTAVSTALVTPSMSLTDAWIFALSAKDLTAPTALCNAEKSIS